MALERPTKEGDSPVSENNSNFCSVGGHIKDSIRNEIFRFLRRFPGSSSSEPSPGSEAKKNSETYLSVC